MLDPQGLHVKSNVVSRESNAQIPSKFPFLKWESAYCNVHSPCKHVKSYSRVPGNNRESIGIVPQKYQEKT